MSKLKKFFISTFIILNFLIMARIHLPREGSVLKSIYGPIDSYLSFFSLYQTWNMFSPDPSKINSFLTAEVEFDDGTKDVFTFPRSAEMSLGRKYVNGERWRVLTEAIRRDDSNFLWRDTARFALRKFKKSHYDKIPLRVHLYRHWDEVPDPEKSFRPHLQRVTSYNTHKFFTYEVF